MVNKYENILIAGDLTIDISGSKDENDNHFSEFKEKLNKPNWISDMFYGSERDLLFTK